MRKDSHMLELTEYTSGTIRGAESCKISLFDESDYGAGGSLSTFFDASAMVTPRSSLSSSVYCTSP